MDEIQTKWNKWIDIINIQAVDLCCFHYIYKKTVEIRSVNPHLQVNSVFFEFIFKSYAAWACSLIRRLVKPHRSAYSLMELLQDIEKRPHVLSREYFLGLYADDNKGFGEIDFNDLVGEHKNHIDPTDIHNDILKLERFTKKIEEFSDKVLSHIDRSGSIVSPVWDDLDNAVTSIERIVLKYRNIIKAQREDLLVDVSFIDVDSVLDKPWITK